MFYTSKYVIQSQRPYLSPECADGAEPVMDKMKSKDKIGDITLSQLLTNYGQLLDSNMVSIETNKEFSQRMGQVLAL